MVTLTNHIKPKFLLYKSKQKKILIYSQNEFKDSGVKYFAKNIIIVHLLFHQVHTCCSRIHMESSEFTVWVNLNFIKSIINMCLCKQMNGIQFIKKWSEIIKCKISYISMLKTKISQLSLKWLSSWYRFILSL